MDIISIVNTMQSNTIKKFALSQDDMPEGETGVPFMGGFVQLFDGATLPDSSDVKNYESAYNSAMDNQQFNSKVKMAIISLELTITERRRDEAILGQDNGWLSDIRSQITVLRKTLK